MFAEPRGSTGAGNAGTYAASGDNITCAIAGVPFTNANAYARLEVKYVGKGPARGL